MRFSGEGASADMRNEGSRIVVDVNNAMITANLSKHMDVSDFATPVQSIDPREQAGGTRLVINTNGEYDSSAYQTGNEYVVEVTPKRVGADRMSTDASRVGGTLGKVAYKGKPATFNFQDVPVRTVLQLIAEESNLNIVAADTVQGNVTLRLINVPWDQALDIVLRAKGLDKRQDGGVIWVAPQKELADYEQAKEDARIAIEMRAETILEYIPVNYGNAEDIAKLLTDDSKSSNSGGAAGQSSSRGFLSPRGSVSFDRRSNTLLIIDLPKKVAEIKQLVTMLDRPVDQVLIEARIVIADEEFARDLGVRLGVTGVSRTGTSSVAYGGNLQDNTDNLESISQTEQANSAVPPPNPLQVPKITRTINDLNVNLPVTTPAGALALSILNGGHVLDLELSAMQTEGKGDVISNPRVITSNQKEALISQGDEIGYVTISGGTTGGATANVQFKDVLLELKVTPTITNDNRVYMALDIKKDELAKFIEVQGFGSVPQITKRQITTAVLVDSGQTVVIGGVYEFKSRQDLTKVPFLGDLPGLGNLFRTTSKNSSKAELLVFVTPKILEVRQRN
jgi:type IV pilus assembly protein PilQ